MPVTGRGGPYGCETSRIPYFLDSQLRDGGEAVSLTCPPRFTSGRFLVLISIRGWVKPRAIMRQETLGKLKNRKSHRWVIGFYIILAVPGHALLWPFPVTASLWMLDWMILWRSSTSLFSPARIARSPSKSWVFCWSHKIALTRIGLEPRLLHPYEYNWSGVDLSGLVPVGVLGRRRRMCSFPQEWFVHPANLATDMRQWNSPALTMRSLYSRNARFYVL
jgi:hypothetical protein